MGARHWWFGIRFFRRQEAREEKEAQARGKATSGSTTSSSTCASSSGHDVRFYAYIPVRGASNYSAGPPSVRRGGHSQLCTTSARHGPIRSTNGGLRGASVRLIR